MIEQLVAAHPFTPGQVQILESRGIQAADAAALGVASLQRPEDLREEMPSWWANHLPGIAFPFTSSDGHTEWQFRPDFPPNDAEGRALKYLMRSTADGYKPTLWAAKTGTPTGRRILVEGSCQTVAAAIYAPADAWVIGMFGCYGWSDDGAGVPDLWDLQSQQVVIAMDGDMWTNPNVWEAGKRLQTNLTNVGVAVASVRWAQLGSGSKATGLDDMLARQPIGRRAEFLANLLEHAKPENFKDYKTPKPKLDPAEDPGGQFFGPDGLRTEKLANSVRGAQPVALTESKLVACYADGVYRVDDLAIHGVCGNLLGDRYRKEHVGNVEKFLASRLRMEGVELPVGTPMLTDRPAVVVANGVLDLTTAQLHPWSPGFMAVYKCPVVWDPAAECPTYDAWISQMIPDQEAQFDEFMWNLLDCSKVPQRAGFLVGRSRSGKGTALRLAMAMAGTGSYSAVSLHQLSDDPFAAANLYGKRLNAAGDLSAAHVRDVSVFKQLTGEDPVNANPKYGGQFTFRNQALFLFAANEIPTVSEQSNAYLNRMVPFIFDNSFEGREDPRIEQAMMRELPGILKRWVVAGLRRMVRGGDWLEAPATVTARFAEGSDRVRMFITEMCDVLPVPDTGVEEPAQHRGTTGQMLYEAFKRWVADSGSSAPMGRNKFTQRIATDPRARAIRIMPQNVRGYNLLIKGH